MADWIAIKSEYINTETSFRALAKKYGVSKNTISAKAKKESWAELRYGQRDRIDTLLGQKTAEVVADTHAERISLLMSGGAKAARMLVKHLDDMEKSGEIRPYEIKVTVEAMKGIRDLYKADDGAPDAKLQRARELLGGVPNALDG